MRILIIDNYDSFTFNLIELLRQLKIRKEIILLKNDDSRIFDTLCDAVIISPGPGLPQESGFLLSAIDHFISSKTPILGVCLGLQAIVVSLGGSLRKLDTVFHGIRDQLFLKIDSPIFQDIKEPYHIGRYHSWAVETLPDSLECIGADRENIVMAVQSIEQNIFAVQFHPESYMTNCGEEILKNYIHLCLSIPTK